MGTRKISDLRYPLVALPSFIQATRDSGYKSTAAAISELLDNSIEANATRIDIRVAEADSSSPKDTEIEVTDNGTGMSTETLPLCLQFGGTTRFDHRDGLGRYGMGLPNGTLSQARRVEVFSWQSPNSVWKVCLDIDDISRGATTQVATPQRVSDFRAFSKSGTVVRLHSCDRLDSRRVSTIERRLHKEFGRIFREFIYSNTTRITVNDEEVRPIDPLFLRSGLNPTGAKPFGPPLEYKIKTPAGELSTVTVRFVELPIDRWHVFSNEEKNQRGISKGAGVSVLRARREIDSGWYFMGSKRKENYDDWWRCEVAFHPSLDEFFGVTHSKQKINPTDVLNSILTPDIERVARQLNSLIRKTYCSIREGGEHIHLRRAEIRDCLLEPLSRGKVPATNALTPEALRHRDGGIAGLKFRIRLDDLGNDALYFPEQARDHLTIVLNSNHPFVKAGFRKEARAGCSKDELALLFVAAARAEISGRDVKARKIVREFLDRWGRTLSAYA